MGRAGDTTNIAVIGAGQMGEALIGGWLAAKVTVPEAVFATDTSVERRDLMKRRFGIRTGADNREAAAWADVVVLAVKPQILDGVVRELAPALAGKLVLSIAAGVTIERLAKLVPRGMRIVRAMPNTPVLVREGLSALSFGAGVTEGDQQLARRLFEAVGRAVVVEEKLMDAVTGLSGSGPAYVFLAIEALADGGVKMGLPRTVADLLAAQTLLGAAKMVLETGEHPAKLKDRVASPGGTTIAGLHRLEQGGFRAALIAAVEAAANRSVELGQQGPPSRSHRRPRPRASRRR
jgi:pyrroline-5-carboxylate reductase